MQAQQTIALPRRTLSLGVAVLAALIAAILAIALVAAVRSTGTDVPGSVVVLHQQAPDAAERQAEAQRELAAGYKQAPDAKERNDAARADQ